MQGKHRCSGAGPYTTLCKQSRSTDRNCWFSLLPPPAVIQEVGLNIDEHTRIAQLTDVLSLLSPRQRKTSPQRLVLTGMLMGFFFFSLCRPFLFYPSIWTGFQTLTISPTLCCNPSLPNCLDRSANHHTPGISLSPAPLSSLSLVPSLSLSYCGGLQCSPNPDWSSVIGLTLSSPARGGISFCSDSIISSLTVTVTPRVGL